MSHPKRGDVVLYSQGGQTYNAIVLATHSLNGSHLGANGEPTLHLSVLFEDRPGARIQLGSIPEPTTIHDVVHASHAFDADYMNSHGLRKVVEGDPQKTAAEAEIKNRRGAGEWVAAIVLEDLPIADESDPIATE